MNDLLKAILPTIATALTGPLGGAAVSFLADKMGVSDKTQEGIQQALSGMTADQLVKMKELDLDFQKFCLSNGIQIQMAQIDVNAKEASSTNWFVAGWRPMVGWLGAIALGYCSIVEPILRYLSVVVFHYPGTFPVIDTTITMQVLFGLLGLGAYRTAEKIKGSEGNR